MGLGIITDLAGMTVDPTPKAARVIIYGPNGEVLSAVDRSSLTPGSAGGVRLAGADYKTHRLLRASPLGSLRASDDMLMLYDSCEGAAVDTNKWIQTVATMTITQAAATGTLFNAGASVAATVGAMQLSHRRFPRLFRSTLAVRFKMRHTAHFSNNLIEVGFGDPASSTATSIGNGACWRKDGTGQYIPVISIGGSEILGTPISNATFLASVAATDYFIAEVAILDDHVHFELMTNAGVLINAQDIDLSGTGVAHFAVTHLQAMERIYNSGATGTAVQLFVMAASVFAIDAVGQRDWSAIMTGMGYSSLTNPATYLQNAQHANSADPAAAVLSNTVPSYTTLGGMFLGPTPTPAGAVTDFALFAFTVPAPYTFYFTGIKITVQNRGVIVATTATVLEWFLAFNASSGSLASAAPYAPMRVDIGRQTFAIGAAIDAVPPLPEVVWTPRTPQAVQPTRTLIVGLRIPVGTATAAGFLRGSVAIDGYFE